jgi:hypothetical protein
MGGTGEHMGDKSPKAKEKNLKQKDSIKAKAEQKAQFEKDALTGSAGKAVK